MFMLDLANCRRVGGGKIASPGAVTSIDAKLNREGIETSPSLAGAPVRVGKTSRDRRKMRQERISDAPI
jgi:hypothetical protein